MGYDGIALGKAKRGEQKFDVKSRIMVDTASYARYKTKPSLELIETPEVVNDLKEETEDIVDEDCVVLGEKQEAVPVGTVPMPSAEGVLTAEQRLITSPTVRGYSLRDKQWCAFFIDSMCDIVWDTEAFSSLVAPQEQKDLILTLAESQVRSRDEFDDFIQGKGKGVIMLLAGPPGVGKTLTAESVAEAMKAPLYSIGAADLGSEFVSSPGRRPPSVRDPGLNSDAGKAASLELKLHDILEMCSKWNAGTSPSIQLELLLCV